MLHFLHLSFVTFHVSLHTAKILSTRFHDILPTPPSFLLSSNIPITTLLALLTAFLSTRNVRLYSCNCFDTTHHTFTFSDARARYTDTRLFFFSFFTALSVRTALRFQASERRAKNSVVSVYTPNPVEGIYSLTLDPQELASCRVRFEVSFERHGIGSHSVRALKVAWDLSFDPELEAVQVNTIH